MTETSIMTVVRTRPPLPADGLCVECKKNTHQYIKKNKYLCRYCWDRDEAPRLAHLTDEELDQHALSLRRSVEQDKVKTSIINVNSAIGFK